MSRVGAWVVLGVFTAAAFACACSSDSAHGDSGAQKTDAGRDAAVANGWQRVFSGLPGALMSVTGTSESDVWASGSDTHDGRGPLLLHYDGTGWTRRVVAHSGDLWWVHVFDEGSSVAGGSNGLVVARNGAHFTKLDAPATKGTVFGVWGATEADVWAVGGDIQFGTGAFVWHREGSGFVARTDLPVDPKAMNAFFKVWGTSATDVWVVGSGATLLHFDGMRFTKIDTGLADDPLFTVHGTRDGSYAAAVGGTDLGVLLERAGATWQAATIPRGTHQLFGVWTTSDGALAVGDQGTVLSRHAGAWTSVSTGLSLDKALHAVWQDPKGGAWAVGGDVLTPPLGSGVLIHRGAPVPTTYSVEDGGLEHVEAGTEAGIDASTGGRGGAGGAGGNGREIPDARPDVVASGGTEGGVGGAGGAGTGGTGTGGTPAFDGGTLPGKIHCGSSVCTLPNETCCADAATGVPSGCVTNPTPCQASEAPVTCDETADCNPGEFCCLDRFTQSAQLIHLSCQVGGCVGPVACKSEGGCTTGTCATFAPMPSYDICQ